MSSRVPMIEPERYEFESFRNFAFDRRCFLRTLGAGLAVFLVLRETASAQQGESLGSRARRFGFEHEGQPRNIGAWLHVGETGGITVYTGKAEMGQNIRTSLSQAVADELRIEVSAVRLVMADTTVTPFDMGTFGSRTTPQMGTQLRRVAAAARELLIQLAAQRWNMKPEGLIASEGCVRDRSSGRVLKYAELARGQTLAKAVIEQDPLTPASEWTSGGKSIPKVDGRAFVTGRHRFSPDVRRPGMLYGRILRPPSFGATLTSLDVSAARDLPGVTVVHEDQFAGVVAPSEELATKALACIRAEWKTTPHISDKELFAHLKQSAGTHQDHGERSYERASRTEGDVDRALASAAHRLDQTYTVAYIAHAPLETRTAVAEWKDGKMTVWTGTQRPFAVRDEVVDALGLSEDAVRVIVPDTGGAYGGKHTGECAVEAARLARAAGKPVHLQWTREEEFTWAYFRPAGVIDIKSGLGPHATLVAWDFQNYNSGGAGIDTPYDVPNRRIEFHPADSPLRQGSYRCLAATANHFARESHMEDLARLVGMDSVDFRRKNLKNERLLAVLDAASRAFGWGSRRREPNRGFGIACGTEKGGYLATCVEISADRRDGNVKVLHVLSAFECGAIVNPDGLKNQIQGAVMMGIGGALFEAIKFDGGRILNNRFSRYRVPRFSDMPRIEVVLIDRKDLPSAGAGEAPIMCLAPAIRNAILDATGIRLFSMPMVPEGLKA